MLKHAKNLFYSPYVRHYATGTEKPASSIPTLAKLGFTNLNVLRNLSVGELYKIGVSRIPPVDPNTKLTTISSTGALCAYSGIKTGRSPKDKRVVQDENSKDVWWGPVNFPLTPKSYELVEERAIAYLNTRPRLYVVDGYAGWDPRYRITIRVVCSRAYHALFMRNMLIVPTPQELARDFSGEVDFHVINAGEFPATPSVEGVATKTCIAVNMTQRRMSILGTQYAGEMKKGVFGVMHYLMPKKGVLSLHASANEGESGDVTLLFGLSGTGKTTLSADPKRKLIGDDEHCWTPDGVFNIEGGCYAKCVNLSAEKEPEIFNAIRFGSILENVLFTDDVNREVNYEDISITENTRATYPLQYIPNCKIPAVGGHPKNIFFLTCDAYGVLPPVAKLDHNQAMYHFISGYTAKVAGTEIGVKEPQATFSACFGEVFLPLHPTVYAEMLAEKMNKHGANAWLINTGWSGGKYGEGKRMDLKVTRAIIDAIHSGDLEKVPTKKMDLFGLEIPETCPGVPAEMLNPRNTWKNKSDYDKTAQSLAALFVKNFDKYADKATKETKAAGPQLH